MKQIKTTPILAMAFILATTIISCKKDARTPPEISFKTGGNYTTGSDSASMNTSFTVGIKGVKTEDELKTLNISFQYDSAATSTTKETITLTKSEYDGFEKDYVLTTRNQKGTEKWIFTITDRDGNIASKEIILKVTK